jgi:L-ornithine Nalpha-acyltransferase
MSGQGKEMELILTRAQMLAKGRYRARLAEGDADIERAQRLRHRSFLAQRGLAGGEGVDADAYDDCCQHVLVEEVESRALVCCYRLMPLASATQIGQSYSAQFYDLSALAAYPGPVLEMGRFCLHPDWHDPDILRLAWGAMTRIVDAAGVRLLFGCSSFQGSDVAKHLDALSLLRAHVAQPQWAPLRRAAQVYSFAEANLAESRDARQGLQAMPSLLRTYLGMGGWVSDHAVIDDALDTLHVFTAVEIDRIPPARARLLRLIAE